MWLFGQSLDDPNRVLTDLHAPAQCDWNTAVDLGRWSEPPDSEAHHDYPAQPSVDTFYHLCCLYVPQHHLREQNSDHGITNVSRVARFRHSHPRHDCDSARCCSPISFHTRHAAERAASEQVELPFAISSPARSVPGAQHWFECLAVIVITGF